MELQNIVIDFKNNQITSMYENIHYGVEDVANDIVDVKVEFAEAYNIDFDFVVVQLSQDQHLDVPRILCNETSPITIQSIAEEHPTLFSKLRNIRLKVEESIQTKLDR
jgi:hypothetical protein